MPSRAASLRRALPAILPQVDRLYLYLDKYDHVPPDLAALPNVVCELPRPGAPSLGSSGKFAALDQHTDPCLFFGFDDDIVYAPDHVAVLTAAIRRHRHRALVGLHAAIYEMPCASYVKNRRLFAFRLGLDYDVCVDELGTGTLAFHSSAIALEHRSWQHANMSDLHLMIDAVRQEVPRIAVRRGDAFAQPIRQNQPDSLYRESLQDDSVQTALLREAMESYPSRWCSSGMGSHSAS